MTNDLVSRADGPLEVLLEQMKLGPVSRTAGIVRGFVVPLPGEDGLGVLVHDTDEIIRCSILHASEGSPLRLKVRDEVLVWHDTGAAGVVLGRIGPVEATETDATNNVDDHIVIEAKHSLTLRVGDGSITIREDGKILIKGKDLVSHAKRMNRIRGGSVAIN
jgi:hypothetical protein